MKDLQNASRSKAGRVRLHRDVLQSEAQAHEERVAIARRVRKAAENENRGCLENSGLFRLLDWLRTLAGAPMVPSVRSVTSVSVTPLEATICSENVIMVRTNKL